MGFVLNLNFRKYKQVAKLQKKKKRLYSGEDFGVSCLTPRPHEDDCKRKR